MLVFKWLVNRCRLCSGCGLWPPSALLTLSGIKQSLVPRTGTSGEWRLYEVLLP